MRRIENAEEIQQALDALVVLDPRLEAVRRAAGPVALRRRAAGFASLASVIVSQQISRTSADAIFHRLCCLVNPLTPENLQRCGQAALVEAGLSRAKQRALMAFAEAVLEGALKLESLHARPVADAMAELCAVPGIGPWTAEVYLLVAEGHPDIFPAGDIALQAAVAQALDLGRRPSSRELAFIATTWSPWRSVAARLFWAFYRAMKGVEAAPIL